VSKEKAVKFLSNNKETKMALPPFILKALSLGSIAMNLKNLSNVVQEAAGITKKIKQIKSDVVEHSPNLDSRVAELEKKIKLQAELSEKLNEQIERVQSVLENVHKSLQFLMYAIYGIGAIALIAIVIALLK
jgi:peptidoglycan hydrolase CwlO-like protein